MARRSRPNGSLEREIIACLAATGAPMTATEVQAELGRDLAYTTVQTTLARLFDKQALSRAPRGRGYAYALPTDAGGAEASLAAHQMFRLLDAGDDRAGVLSRFVDSLDDETEALLRKLLEEER
jgi:predicted transcriptional regulator